MDNFKKISQFLVGICFLIILVSCDTTPDITDAMMDGKLIFDPSLDKPEDYLLSLSKPNPTPEEASKPVFILMHGYSASTYEWEEFRSWSGNTTDYFLSIVLLGGHGRTYEEFKQASWRDWQKSIKEEYERLMAAGYSNINFIGSSTSCTLLIDLVHSNFFHGKVIPRNILLVDPIIIPSSKILSLVPLVGPIIGYIEADNTSEEDKYWYHFRPQETLQELNKILTRVRKQLENGVNLPPNCSVKVYKSIKDPTADPVSAVLIYKGMKSSNGAPVEIEMIDSDLHVFTRLNLRPSIQPKDRVNQITAFEDFVSKVN
ncbi:alpha/beta hydrolase [Cecembia rubra]|uniref:Carboxylesterase n=1 Tax=Cecembia rubra TaxID=1485585 RepID=A0A2P8EDS2_9BACT|nr:esterase [Cecembia rubra]PSL07626.1 carboxylesterase [Cecembia rubra]